MYTHDENIGADISVINYAEINSNHIKATAQASRIPPRRPPRLSKILSTRAVLIASVTQLCFINACMR